jgi:hypothetical protein
MNLKLHKQNDINIVELVSDESVINSIDDFNDLLATTFLEKSRIIIIHDRNINFSFFSNDSNFNKEIQFQLIKYIYKLLLLKIFIFITTVIF